MSEFISNNEIYQKLKSGRSPRFIKGIESFDTSELVQWLCSYHEGVKSELLEALNELCRGWDEKGGISFQDILNGRAAIAKALGESK